MSGREAVHRDPVWRDRSDFIIAIQVDPGDTDVTTEQLWARRVDDRHFELCCIPFFASDLALGDTVEVNSNYLVERVTASSGRYVFRVYFPRANLGFVDAAVEPLIHLGALVEWSSPTMFAVDARDAVHAQQIADFLHAEEQQGRLVYETGRRCSRHQAVRMLASEPDVAGAGGRAQLSMVDAAAEPLPRVGQLDCQRWSFGVFQLARPAAWPRPSSTGSTSTTSTT